MVLIGWVFGFLGGVFYEIIYFMFFEEVWFICNFIGSEVGFFLWFIYNVGFVIVCIY